MFINVQNFFAGEYIYRVQRKYADTERKGTLTATNQDLGKKFNARKPVD